MKILEVGYNRSTDKFECVTDTGEVAFLSGCLLPTMRLMRKHKSRERKKNGE